MSSMLELQDLYNEALVREIIEKTQNCGLTWSAFNSNQYKSTQTIETVVWEFSVSKTQIGNTSYKYSFDVKKDNAAYLNVQDGPLPNTTRDSAVKELFDTVEVIVRQLDSKVKEAIQIVQNLTDCHG